MLKTKNNITSKMIMNEKNNALRENNLINTIDKINHREDDYFLNKVLNNCSTRITIEEPVEHILSTSTSQNSFEEAIKKTMRLSPGTIMIGELRDRSQNLESGLPVMTSVNQAETIKILCERFNIT